MDGGADSVLQRETGSPERDGQDGKNGKYWWKVKDNSEMDRRGEQGKDTNRSRSAASFHV